MPFAIIKLKIILKILKIDFWPLYQGSEKLQKPIISRKIKIIVWGCLIAQMKRFDALITTRKTPVLCKVPFRKKSRKNAQNYNFSKITIFCSFFLFLKKWDLAESWGFCVVISVSKRFIWAIKHPRTMIFIFWVIIGFLQFFRPLLSGVKSQI